MMKAEELMIGDLLRYSGQFAKFDFRVERITRNKVGYRPDPADSRIAYLSLDEVQPIPLTAEILERNGFEKVQNLLVLKLWKGFCPSLIFVEYNPANRYLFFNDMMLPRPILFVHQLQQALLLCDINKEIIL